MRATATNKQVVVLLCSLLIFFSPIVAAPFVFTGTATASDTSVTEGSGDWVTVNDTVSLSVDNTQTVGEAKVILENPHSGDELRVNESVNDNISVKRSASNTTDRIGDTRMVIELESADGEATEVSDFEEVFQTAEFRNTESETSLEDRRVRFSLGSRLPMDETGHYYGHSASERSWSNAESADHTYPYKGTLSRDGYLATIRSPDENEWVSSVAGSNRVWLAAKDSDGDQDEGEWEWEAGSPEDEVRFWTEDGGLQFGYENWASGEPNDDGGENRLEMMSDGTWNDADGTTSKQYVYEYGDHAIGSDLNTVERVKIADLDTGGDSFPLTEDFNSGSVPSNWTLGGDADWGGSSDGSGSDSTLQLTTDGEYEAGYGLFDEGFSSEQGVYAEFDYYAGDGTGADGLSFFLVNGTVTDASNIGTSSTGGSGLGYSHVENKSDLDGEADTDAFVSDPDEQGVPNGYIGVGFDEYGAFSSDTEGKDGGEKATDDDPTDREQHNVVIRGEGDLGATGNGYAYETGRNVTDIDTNYRIDNGWRKVRVNVQPAASGGTNLTVDMSWNDGDDWETVIDQYTYGNNPPSTLKLGFAGSTGGSTNYHAIDNLEVSQLPIISNLRAANPTGDELDFQFDADQQLSTINVDVTSDNGSPSKDTLDRTDFTETENSDGNYTYRLDTELTGNDGGYDLTIVTAANSDGLDGAAGQSDSVTITSPPSISTFSLDEGEGDAIKTTIEADKELNGIEVDIEDPDGDTDTLSRIDFTETEESGTYTYTADYATEETGTYNGTVQSAEDEDGKDGAGSEVDTVEISEPDDSDGGVRSATKDDRVFLGGDFIELGIREDGGFGTEVTAPSSFFGNDRGFIGMYSDVDGFYNDTYDFRYEYFLPGSPEERWSMGYGGSDTGTTASNGRNVWGDPEMSTIDPLSDESTSNTAAANLTSEFDDLEIDHKYELQPNNRYYKTTVSIENTGSSSLSDVRYQRSFDPDNGVDEGCSFTTNNTVVNQQPEDDNVLVKAELQDGDTEGSYGCDVGDVSDIPVFFYSVEPDARVSYGDFGLVPDNPPYADRDWDNPPEAGSTKTADSYIAITFDAGTVEDGETVEYTYYTALTDDVDATLADVEKEAEAQEPVADAGSNRTVDVGKTVEFDGSNSSANVSIDSYDWDFDGDGTTDASGEKVTHSYDEAGTYEIELNVTDAQGQSDTDTATITVEDPPGLSLSDGESEFVEFRGPVTVDSDLELTSPSDLDGAVVQIEDGFDSDSDVLNATENHGITKSYDSTTGVLSLTGEATASEYQEVLRSVTYNNTERKPDSIDREIVFTAGPDVIRSEETGLFYEYVEDSGVTWTEARDAAESRDHFGLDGSLTTITSEAENDFLVGQFDDGGWIGASDADEESIWRWVTGPEGLEADGNGRHFFDQTASHTGSHRFAPVYPTPPEGVPGGGEAVDGEYENWDPRHEPNNKFPMKSGQDYGYLCSDTRGCSGGQWMDLNGDLPSEPEPAGYFAQYGGMPGDRNVTTSDSRTVAVTKDRTPTAKTGTSEIEANLTDEIEFNASASSDDFDIVSYEWDLYDNGTTDATGESVTHSYESDGTYTVTLTVEDNQGQTDSDTMTVDIEDNTVRIADAGPTRTVNEGRVIELDGSNSEATGDISAYDWDLGSGETTGGEKPTVSYDEPGTYTVELEITDEFGKTATDTTTIEVRDTTTPDADAGSDTSVDEGTAFEFNASASADNVGIDSYEWDLYGNGTTDLTDETPTHTFDEPGTYEVELTTSDAAGNTDRDTVTITVNDSTAPTAILDVDETTVREGEPVEFDAGDSEDNVALESFEWDFDDGLTNGTGVTTTHRYAEAGTYEVTLTANDTSGNTDTNTTSITVEAAPELSANGTETEYVEKREPTVVNDSLDISGSGDIGGATVSIDDGFEDGDTLSYNNSLANENGISGRYDAESGVLSFEGMASETAYRDVLRSVTFAHDGSDPSEADRTITFSLGEDGLYFDGAGHYYEYVADDGITWHEARAAANDSYHLGLQGYLVTVTSEDENEFVRSKLGGAGWMGASDADTEGTWRWVTGPEGTEDGGDGRHFFTQTASDDGTPDVYGGNTPGGGDAVGSNYANWDVNEPNDHRTGEDYAHFCMDMGWCPDGKWNDFQYDHPDIDGYVVEYGGMDGDPDLNLTDTTTVTVERDDAPRAEAGSDVEVGLDEQVEFDANESSDDFGIETYEWDFDDGNTSRGESILHDYSSDGSYEVTLTVTDTSYQTGVDTLDVRVIDNSVLVANTGGNYTVDEGETVTLDARASEASAGIASYAWDFDGDGTTDDTGPTAEFTEDDPGTYEVNLTITDETDNTVSTTTSVEVADITAPTADAGSDLTVDNGTAASFNATGSSDNAGIDAYEWDFTDNGVTDTTGDQPEYTYPAPGNYTAELTTTDAAGNSDTDTADITVNDVEPPTVDAGLDRTVEVLESLEFDGSNSTDDLAIESYEWDLYDNGTTDATGTRVDHTYAVDKEGSYEVTLTVTDTNGNAATDTLTVDVQNTTPTLSSLAVTNPEDHDIEVSFDSDQPLDSIAASIDGAEEATLSEANFTETETDGGYRYEATHAGSTGGVYNVTIDNATDAAGNDAASTADESAVTGSVRTLSADVSAVSYVASVGSEVSFDASDTFVPDSQSEPTYEWDFDGDGTTDATGEAVSHEFTSPGEIEATLTATTDTASSEDSTNITVEDRAPPETRLDPVDPLNNNTAVTFDASATTDDVGVDRYEWDFGDGTTDSGSTIDQPSHTYSEPGEYTATVTTIDSSGNEATNETTVLVKGPVANVTTTSLQFGDTPVDANSTLSVPVENEGNVPLEITTGTGISGTDSALFELVGEAASLPTTIQPGETETVTVEYSPNAVATHGAQLDLATNHSHGDFSIDFDGSGVDSDLKPQSTKLQFGTVDTGSETSDTITFKNEGDGPSDLDSIEIVGTDAGAFTVENVPDEIAAGELNDVSIGFQPTHAGAHNATLRIENATGQTTATVPLSGFGNGPEIALGGDTVSFGDVGKNVSKAKTITVANHGTEPLDLDNVTFDGSGSDAFAVESAPATVAAGDSEEIQIGFTPTDAREYETSLVVEHNDPLTETRSPTVTGTGVAANIDASPRTLNFEETAVGETAYNRIKVRNLATSKTTLTVDKTDLVGKNPDQFGVENGGAPFSLEPGQSRYINVSFTPESADSESSAQLHIESDAGNEPQISVWLSSSDTYIVVQQVATDSSSADDEPTVNLDAYNVDTGSELGVNVSQPSTRANDVGFDSYGMTTANHERFEINTTHADDPIGRDAAEYTPKSDEAIVEYVRLNHTVDADTTFDDTTVTYRVAKDRVETDSPDDVTLYRYNGSSWNEMPATQIGETETHYRYSSETPGFSQFVVGAPTQTDSTDDDGGTGDSDGDSTDSSGDDGSDGDSDGDSTDSSGDDSGGDSTDDSSDDGTGDDSDSTDSSGDDSSDGDSDGDSTDDSSDDGTGDDSDSDSTDDTSDDGTGDDSDSTDSSGDDTDTGNDGDTGDTPDGESEPTGDTQDDDLWGDRADFQNRTGIEIVDSHLTVDRTDGVNATSIVVLHNGANVSQDVDVRFIMNGTQVRESTVTVAPDERVNVSHVEAMTTPGVHTFESNVAAETAGGDQMRTFDFAVGTVEVTEDELTVTDTATDDETGAENNTATTDDGFPWLVIILAVGISLLLLLLLLAYRRRDDKEDEKEADIE